LSAELDVSLSEVVVVDGSFFVAVARRRLTRQQELSA